MELKEGLSQVKSGLTSIHPFYIRQYLKQIKSLSHLDIEIGKSLGAASVGETFLAYVQGRKEPIVVKFMRPGIEEIAGREAVFFETAAKKVSKGMVDSFHDLKEQILEEMDYRTELHKLRAGYKAYNEPGEIIRVVAPMEDFPNNKYWMAMTLAPGKTFKEVTLKGPFLDEESKFRAKVDMLIKGLLLNLLAEKFIHKTFFLSPEGFFHGDLHEGNMLMSIDPKVYSLLRKNLKHPKIQNQSFDRLYLENLQEIMTRREHGEPLIKLTLIDFGNAHTLTKDQREGMLNLFVASTNTSNSAEAFLKAINQLLPLKSQIPESNFPAYQAELRREIFNSSSNSNSFGRIGKAIDILMSQDAPVPNSIIAFSRSLAMIDRSYDLVNQAFNGQFGKKEINLTRVFEKSTICPMLNQIVNFAHFGKNAILKYFGFGTDTSCSQFPDVELSLENKKGIICNVSTFLCQQLFKSEEPLREPLFHSF